MTTSIWDPQVQATINAVRSSSPPKRVMPSPEDWRDLVIYFLLVDRFNNPVSPPRSTQATPPIAFDAPYGSFQGGTIEGVTQKLDYLKDLGIGAIWISPILCNVQFLNGQPNEGTYHGYGIQNFLRIDPRMVKDPNHADEELINLIEEAHKRGIYIILDIVLNHAGDVFAYDLNGNGRANFRGGNPYPIYWRDETGRPRQDWQNTVPISNPPLDAVVFPDELRQEGCFRKEGTNPDLANSPYGDFETLKQFRTEDTEVGSLLIRIHQYLIAKYDIDGFRIDTLKYLNANFAYNFGNAVREFALSIGKKNFFTYGEVYDQDAKIAQFIGRNTQSTSDSVGVDAALDFPLFFKLPSVAKGSMAPSEIAQMYQNRKKTFENIVSSHGEASRYFVTFIDNHDQTNRFYFQDSGHQFDDQLTLAVACLFSLPGIPCLYYGTEQGLHGYGSQDLNVREALWGAANAFSSSHPFYQHIQALNTLRQTCAPLRYGRFYFRPISGDRINFSLSTTAPGVLSYSRILNDQEVVVVANANTSLTLSLTCIVDQGLNPQGSSFSILYSNKSQPTAPDPVVRTGSNINVQEVTGGISHGPVSILPLTLQPMEVQILARPT
jgi:glycosidase